MQNAAQLTTPRALVENVMQLISLPEIYLRLQQTIDDPSHSRDQVAEIIAYDPALSARVLRIVNSSYYGFPREFGSVNEAVGIIGEIELRNLVLATTVIGTMNRLEGGGVDIDAFWLHSLRCGITARLLARATGGCDPEILFLGGILHDLGILVIYQQDPALAAAVKRQIDDCHQLRDQAERELLGFDHAEIGALLLQAWGLSGELIELARCHHQYQLARDHRHTTLILALANLLAGAETEGSAQEDARSVHLLQQFDLPPDSVKEVLASAAAQCAEIRNIILG